MAPGLGKISSFCLSAAQMACLAHAAFNWIALPERALLVSHFTLCLWMFCSLAVSPTPTLRISITDLSSILAPVSMSYLKCWNGVIHTRCGGNRITQKSRRFERGTLKLYWNSNTLKRWMGDGPQNNRALKQVWVRRKLFGESYLWRREDGEKGGGSSQITTNWVPELRYLSMVPHASGFCFRRLRTNGNTNLNRNANWKFDITLKYYARVS